MCFKGTSNRPSPTAIAHELDALGAESNAFTSYEYTGYYAKARSKNFPKLLDVIADLYLHPTLPEAEIEKEKGVIIEEINMYEDLPMRNIGTLLDKLMYGEQPAGRKILGTKEIIRRTKREDFLRYRGAHYVPQATTLVVAGDISSAEVFRQAKKYFAPSKKSPKEQKPKVRDTQRAPAALVEYKKSSQTHFQLGFRGVPVGHKDIFAMDVLRTVLGAGMSSRLFKKLREEMGVCYYVRAESEYNLDHGKFVVASGVDIARVELVLTVIMDELRAVKKNSISPEELQKAKEYLLGTTAMGLESSDEVAGYFGGQEILRRPLMSPEEYAAKIRTVSAAQVRAVAKKLFKNSNTNLALIGPFKTASKFKGLIRL
jgi:predicted Zn-dependent peptidase